MNTKATVAALVALPQVFAAPSPAFDTDVVHCHKPTFKLINPIHNQWGLGKYAGSFAGDQFSFVTNSSSDATTYTIDAATGYLYSTDTAYAWWAGSISGHDAAVRFEDATYIADQIGASAVNCQVPKKNGEPLSCQGDGSGEFGQWTVCYGNDGGIGVSLTQGNSSAPYVDPKPVMNWLYCGKAEAQVQHLGCADQANGLERINSNPIYVRGVLYSGKI